MIKGSSFLKKKFKETFEAHQAEQLMVPPRSWYRFCLAIKLSNVQSCLRLPVLQSVWEEGLSSTEAVL